MFLEVPHSFDLRLTLGMDQALRWSPPDARGWHTGVVWASLVRLRQTGDGSRIEFHGTLPHGILKHKLHNYLRLDEDVAPTHKALCRSDPYMARLVQLYGGMRILRQDPWECLITYAVSPRHQVERIRQAVEQLAERFGAPISSRGNHRITAFPTPARLAGASIWELGRLKLGLPRHASYVHALAQEVHTGSLDLEALTRSPYGEAKSRLMQCKGIGPKVADCVLLFSLDKPNAFAMDTHVRRALVKLYGLTGTDAERLRCAQDRFGPHAGYVSQLLFHGMRNGAI